MISDKAIGTVATLFIAAFLVYYTFWLLILPFIRNESGVTAAFPDAYYGLAVPTACIIVIVAVVLSYTGLQLCLGTGGGFQLHVERAALKKRTSSGSNRRED